MTAGKSKQSTVPYKGLGKLLAVAIRGWAALEGLETVHTELSTLGISVKEIRKYMAGTRVEPIETFELLVSKLTKYTYISERWMQDIFLAYHDPTFQPSLQNFDVHSLPPPKCKQLQAIPQNFIERPLYTQIVEALKEVKRKMVIIHGAGGIGKTSLALAIAERARKTSHRMPRYDGIVWIEANNQHGDALIDLIEGDITATFGYSDVINRADRTDRMRGLWRDRRVLLFINDFDPLDDQLRAWLTDLHEESTQSKIVSTCIETRYIERYKHNWVKELKLDGMCDTEAWQFLDHLLGKNKRDDLFGTDALGSVLLKCLMEITKGNPAIIKMAINEILNSKDPINELKNIEYNDNFINNLFDRKWSRLNKNAKRILYAMTFFPKGASLQALKQVSGVRNRGNQKDLDKALKELTLLGLLDDTSRYTIHDLTNIFILEILSKEAKIKTLVKNEIRNIYQRWVHYYKSFITKHLLRKNWPGTYWNTEYWNTLIENKTQVELMESEWKNIRLILQTETISQDLTNESIRQNLSVISILSMIIGRTEYVNNYIDFTLLTAHYLDQRGLFTERLEYANKAVRYAQQYNRIRDASILWIDAIGWLKITTEMHEQGYISAEEDINRGIELAKNLSTNSQEARDLRVLGDAFLSRLYLLWHASIKTSEEKKKKQQLMFETKVATIRPQIMLVSPIIGLRVSSACGAVAFYTGNYATAISDFNLALYCKNAYGGESYATDEIYVYLGFAYLKLSQLDSSRPNKSSLNDAKNAFDNATNLGGKIYLWSQYGQACISYISGYGDDALRKLRKSLEPKELKLRLSYRIDILMRDIKNQQSFSDMQLLEPDDLLHDMYISRGLG